MQEATVGKYVTSIATLYGSLHADLKAKVLTDHRGLQAFLCGYLAGRFTDITIDQRSKVIKSERSSDQGPIRRKIPDLHVFICACPQSPPFFTNEHDD